MKPNNLALFTTLLLIGPTLLASAATNSIPVSYDNNNLRPLGAGFNSRAQVLYGKCVDNQTDQGTSPPTSVKDLASGSFDLKVEKSQSAVADKLGIGASGRYKTGVTTTSASADFLNQSSSNEFSLSYTYVAEQLYQESIEASRANPIRPLPGFARIVGKSDLFFNSCGDEYISARNFAARVLVNINVSFVSKAERNRFATEFGVSSPALDLKAKLEKDHASFSSGNRMTVRAVQIGGDPSKIGRILCPKNKDGMPDPECEKSSRSVVNCSFGEIGECTNLIANAIAYTNSLDPDNFPSQIEDFKNYQVTALEAMPYTTLGDPFVRPPSAAGVATYQAALKQVNDLFDVQHKYWTLSNQLLNGRAPRLSDREKSEMEVLQNIHFKNLSQAATSIDACYDEGQSQCTKEVDKLRSYIGIDKKGDIESDQYKAIIALTAPESFVQYCDVADADHPRVGLTVNALTAYAKSKVNGEVSDFNKGDRCANLGIWLDAQKEIDLSDPALAVGDLGPIAALKNLETLTLRNKGIQSVQALGALTNLKNLNLDGNEITDVSPLTKLTSLERLSVQNNRVGATSMATLAALDAPNGRLAKLDARGNSEAVTCPLKLASACKVKSFADYADISSASTKCAEMAHHQSVDLGNETVLAVGGLAFPGVSARMQLVHNSECTSLPQTLTIPRIGHTMTLTKNGIVVVGGGSNSMELISPKNYATSLYGDRLPTNLTQHTATLLSGDRILIVGGATDADPLDGLTKPSGLSDAVLILNPNGKVEVLGHLSVPRSGHTATLLQDGTVLILGGYSLNKMVDIAEIIDPDHKTVTMVEKPLPVGRTGHSATLLANGHVFIAGGSHWADNTVNGKVVRSSVPVSDLVDYDPANKSVPFRTLEEKLVPARVEMQSVLTNDNRVLLIGGLTLAAGAPGENLSVRSASSEIQVYDPTSEGIYHVGSMLNHLIGFTATAVGTNSVLVFGGRTTWVKDESTGKLSEEERASSAELLVYRPR